MFTNLKQKSLENKFDKRVLKSTESRIVSDKKIQTVGILTTDEISSKIDLRQETETILNIRNAKIYSYRNYNKLDKVSYKHFSEKDIDWNGSYKELSFLNFLEQPFDLLIGFYNKKNLYLEYATLQSQATFKVGFTGVNSELFELEISENIENVKQYNLELRKYLLALNKLKN